MTTDEAMQAVKKAVESLPEEGDDIWMWPHSYEETKAVIAALRAIAPDGPLVCVPREPTEKMLEKGNDAAQLFGKLSSVYRAMIAEGEKT